MWGSLEGLLGRRAIWQLWWKFIYLLVRLYYSEFTLRPHLRAPAHKVKGWLRVRRLTKACNKILTHEYNLFFYFFGE